MNRVAFVMKVRKDKIDAYKAAHQNVWPEMLAALRRAGRHNYSLFLREDGLLFGYYETPETPAAAREKMSKEEVNARWQAAMAPLFEALGEPNAGERLVELQEVFHLD